MCIRDRNSRDIRSVVITGEGAMFCAGGNLQRLQANRHEAPEVQAQSIEGLHNWIDSIRTYPKPVIAAVEGAAVGAGFSLALACDFVVTADNAVFAMSYSNWIDSIRTYPKPVIAAVEGAAVGAGFSLALACDFVVTADNAVFAMSYS